LKKKRKTNYKHIHKLYSKVIYKFLSLKSLNFKLKAQDESSISRQKRANDLTKTTKEDFLSILGDADDEKNPIYMTGNLDTSYELLLLNFLLIITFFFFLNLRSIASHAMYRCYWFGRKNTINNWRKSEERRCFNCFLPLLKEVDQWPS